MDIALIGWQVAGWAGAAATTLALLGRLHARHPNAPLGRAIRRA